MQTITDNQKTTFVDHLVRETARRIVPLAFDVYGISEHAEQLRALSDDCSPWDINEAASSSSAEARFPADDAAAASWYVAMASVEVPIVAARLMGDTVHTVAHISDDALEEWTDIIRECCQLAEINVVVSNIDAAVLRVIEHKSVGLDMRWWHGGVSTPVGWCNTTHCRAGAAIVAAGDDGIKLEHAFGSAVAGSIIYALSRPGPIPDFYATDNDALVDIRACVTP